jgi:hypothetical protein
VTAAGAREAIAIAEQRLRERAARIENDAHRASFLERVRRTLARSSWPGPGRQAPTDGPSLAGRIFPGGGP